MLQHFALESFVAVYFLALFLSPVFCLVQQYFRESLVFLGHVSLVKIKKRIIHFWNKGAKWRSLSAISSFKIKGYLATTTGLLVFLHDHVFVRRAFVYFSIHALNLVYILTVETFADLEMVDQFESVVFVLAASRSLEGSANEQSDQMIYISSRFSSVGKHARIVSAFTFLWANNEEWY